MKVIVAGPSKTGTKSLNKALTELGYEVYDYLEHFMYHGEEWMKIFKGHGEISDFKKMYKGVDAVIDSPAYIYWNEIHQAFPDAKIILTTRDEESWFKSLKSMEKVLESVVGISVTRFLPISRRLNRFWYEIGLLQGIYLDDGWLKKKAIIKKMNALLKFRQHNAAVLQMAPKDKLLVYNVKEGWEPLCKFLDKEIPEKPFPHANIGGKELHGMKEHEFARKISQQLIISIVVLLIVCFVICYISSEYSVWMGLSTFLCVFALLRFIL